MRRKGREVVMGRRAEGVGLVLTLLGQGSRGQELPISLL